MLKGGKFASLPELPLYSKSAIFIVKLDVAEIKGAFICELLYILIDVMFIVTFACFFSKISEDAVD